MSESTDCNVVAHPPGVVDLLEHLVDFTHDGLGPLPGQGGPVVKYHLVQLAGPWGAGQPVAPQILTGRLHLPPTPGVVGTPPG